MPLCPHCGKENPAEAAVCEACGAALTPAPPPAEIPPTVPTVFVGTPVPPRPSRRRFLVLGLVVLLLLVAVAVFLMLRGPRQVDLAAAVGPTTQFWLEIDVRPTPQRTANLQSLLQALDKSGLQDKINDALKADLQKGEEALNWERDIKPWIGYQVGLAVSGFSPTAVAFGNTNSLRVLALLTVRDVGKARQTLRRLSQQQAKKSGWITQEKEQDGITIYSFESPEGERLFCAVEADVFFISGAAAEITDAVARLQGKEKENLSTLPWFIELRRKAPPETVAQCVISEAFYNSMYGAGGASAKGLYGNGILWLTPTKDGLDTGGYSTFPAKQAATIKKNLAQFTASDAWRLLEVAPKEAIFSLAYDGLGSLLSLMNETMKSTAMPVSWDQIVQGINKEIGLDLQGEAARQLTGLTFSLLSFSESLPYVEMVVELRGKERAAMQQLTSRMEAKLQQRLGGASPQPVTIAGVPCRKMGFGPVGVYYTIHDTSLLVSLTETSLGKALTARADKTKSLAATPAWASSASMHAPHALFTMLVTPTQIADQIARLSVLGEAPEEVRYILDMLASFQNVAGDGGVTSDGYFYRAVVAVNYDTFFTALANLIESGSSSFREEALPGPAGESIRKTQCLSNVKNLSIGMNMYVLDNNRFPSPATWVTDLGDYVANSEVFRCPEDFTGARSSYGMNAALAKLTLDAIQDTARFVTIYETAHPGDNPSGGKDDVFSPPRHGKGNNYGFANGSARWQEEPTNDTVVQWREK